MEQQTKKWTDNTFAFQVTKKDDNIKHSRHFNPPEKQIEKLKKEGRWKH